MVVGYWFRGQLLIKRVAAKAKVHAVYFQEEVMRLIYLQDILWLNGRDASKLQIHVNKASSRTAKFMAAILPPNGRLIWNPFLSIPVNSSDASPMDFCDFGLLKEASL
ncbi:hypothetical protein C0J52_21198 [Blattella germanica]|nr:hypothetical protein C0J52_21198 [Blattella germanica]